MVVMPDSKAELVGYMSPGHKSKHVNSHYKFSIYITFFWITKVFCHVFVPSNITIMNSTDLYRCRFDSKLNDVLDPSQASSDSRLDSRIQSKIK